MIHIADRTVRVDGTADAQQLYEALRVYEFQNPNEPPLVLSWYDRQCIAADTYTTPLLVLADDVTITSGTVQGSVLPLRTRAVNPYRAAYDAARYNATLHIQMGVETRAGDTRVYVAPADDPTNPVFNETVADDVYSVPVPLWSGRTYTVRMLNLGMVYFSTDIEVDGGIADIAPIWTEDRVYEA